MKEKPLSMQGERADSLFFLPVLWCDAFEWLEITKKEIKRGTKEQKKVRTEKGQRVRCAHFVAEGRRI